jgi:hypothetical protein
MQDLFLLRKRGAQSVIVTDQIPTQPIIAVKKNKRLKLPGKDFGGRENRQRGIHSCRPDRHRGVSTGEKKNPQHKDNKEN